MGAPNNPNPEQLLGPPPVQAPAIDFRTGPPAPNFEESRRGQHALTARTLAYWLIGILGGSVVLQYAALIVLICKQRPEESPVFEHLFNAWLPVIAGLASSAATYYF